VAYWGLGDWRSYDYFALEELLIHNLEDGGVILYYEFGTPEENEAEMTKLEAVARGYRKTVIAPYEGIETRYTLVAWQRLQAFNDINEDEMRQFLEAFEEIDHH